MTPSGHPRAARATAMVQESALQTQARVSAMGALAAQAANHSDFAPLEVYRGGHKMLWRGGTSRAQAELTSVSGSGIAAGHTFRPPKGRPHNCKSTIHSALDKSWVWKQSALRSSATRMECRPPAKPHGCRTARPPSLDTARALVSAPGPQAYLRCRLDSRGQPPALRWARCHSVHPQNVLLPQKICTTGLMMPIHP